MPNVRTETFGGSSDMRWLASTHGAYNAETMPLKAANFGAVISKFSKVPAGLPVGLKNGDLHPYGGQSDIEFAGHLLFDADGRADNGVPVVVHALVHKGKVPTTTGSYTPPVTQPRSSITYL